MATITIQPIERALSLEIAEFFLNDLYPELSPEEKAEKRAEYTTYITWLLEYLREHRGVDIAYNEEKDEAPGGIKFCVRTEKSEGTLHKRYARKKEK